MRVMIKGALDRPRLGTCWRHGKKHAGRHECQLNCIEWIRDPIYGRLCEHCHRMNLDSGTFGVPYCSICIAARKS